MENSTIVMACDCASEFQDKEYGKGMRLHNISQGGTSKGKVAYCTVCSPRTPRPQTNDPLRKGKTIK